MTRTATADGVATQVAEPTTGIGHTRWATHGHPSERNAHPHPDCTGEVHIVLNGIVENYVDLRAALEAEGHEFASETDAEVVAHLIEKHLDQLGDDASLAEATRLAYLDLRGHYAFVAVWVGEPDTIVGARKECPLVVGVGEDEHFIASAIPAFLRETRRVMMVQDDEIVIVRPWEAEFRSAFGEPVEREIEEVTWDDDAAEKSGYPTFMLKEIHEQADAVAETIADRMAHADRVELADVGIDDADLARVRRIVVVACGTSYHAGVVGRYVIEEWARLPVELDIASEYRYRNPVVGPDDLVIGISQSGETADTLAAMRLAREQGAQVLAITNILGSQATRDADGVLYTRAGLEIGVAATKTFLAEVAAMYLLALKLTGLRGTLPPSELERLISELKAMPHKIEVLLGILRAADARDRRDLPRSRVLPVPGPPHRASGLPRRRPEAQGDLLYPDRGLRGGGDEARPDRSARRIHRPSFVLRRTRRCSRRCSPISRRSRPEEPR